MTRSELKELVRQCLGEVRLNIEEGAILNVQETAENIRDKFRYFYSNYANEMFKQNQFRWRKYTTNPFENEYSRKEIQQFANWINRQFFYKLSKNESPVKISFQTTSNLVWASYITNDRNKKGVIVLSTFKYLAIQSGNLYKLISPDNFDYDEFTISLEHELIHAEQHLRSGKKYKLVKGIASNDPEVKKMIANKLTKPLSVSDEDYAEYVNYYNTKAELNTHAKDVANDYVKWWTNILKQKNRYFSAETVKSLVSSVFTNPQQPNNRVYLDHLLSLFPEYRYLTPKNRNKWWNYVYKSILGMKYSDVNQSSLIPQNENINVLIVVQN